MIQPIPAAAAERVTSQECAMACADTGKAPGTRFIAEGLMDIPHDK